METFIPDQVCSRMINFEVTDGKLRNLQFAGGCPGNNLGIISLVEGMSVEEVIEKLKGLPCGSKSTSCPDQLSIALTEWKERQA